MADHAPSWNKSSVSASVRHKGQRSLVYFGLEMLKRKTEKTFEFPLFLVSYKTNCHESRMFLASSANKNQSDPMAKGALKSLPYLQLALDLRLKG